MHALAVLARSDEGASSAYVAGSVNTHAVALRRVLGELVEAGLVEAQVGRGGGYRLARDPRRITLADVYEVIEPEGPLAPNPAEPNPYRPVGSGIRTAFAAPARKARKALLAALAKEIIAELAQAAVRAGNAAPKKKV
ncbi:MAG: Rrf2 family transcriptional regulator [Myxococcota bacterium]